MNWKTGNNQKLIEAILSLKTSDEAQRFLRDLMTEGEIAEFGRRLYAADLLTQKRSYLEIQDKTGFSSTTVARVAKWLNGKGGGYRDILNKLHHHDLTQSGRRLS